MDEIAAAEVTRIRQVLKAHMPALRETYHVASLSLFGSYVRGEQQPGSDLDLLVTFDEMPSLLTFVDLKLTLSDLLGVEVDLVMRSALKPHIGERILDEAVPVWWLSGPIHRTFGVDLVVVWKAVTEDVPALIPLVAGAIEAHGEAAPKTGFEQ